MTSTFRYDLKKTWKFFIFCTLCIHLISPVFAKESHPFLVVIDPGHGGKDFGATFQVSPNNTLYEKTLTLHVGTKLENALEKKNIQAIMTRRNDINVPLDERTAIANRVDADVFISLHFNNSPEHATGVETFILNNSTDETSKRLAELENSVLKDSEADFKKKHSGFFHAHEHQSDVSLIVKDLMLGGNLIESKKLACIVQKKTVRATSPKGWVRKRNRGVKQALFYVLLGADMPSILFEGGFLNHPMDRKTFDDPQDKKKMANAIAEAIQAYQNKSATHRSFGNCSIH